jgi:hypothetical protein
MAYPKKMSIGDLLIKQQIITYDQLQFALEEKKRTGLSVEAVLMAQGIVSDEHIAQARATQLRVPYVTRLISSLWENCPKTRRGDCVLSC